MTAGTGAASSVTVYLLLDPSGAMLRTEVVSGWDALEKLDREAREIGGLLVPLLGARDYRRTTT